MMKRRDSWERKDNPKKSVEFRQPSPPTKPKAALKGEKEGRKTSAGCKDALAGANTSNNGEDSSASSTGVRSKSDKDKLKGAESSSLTSGSERKAAQLKEGPARSSLLPLRLSPHSSTPRQAAHDISPAAWSENSNLPPVATVPSVPAWPASPQSCANPWQAIPSVQSEQPLAPFSHSWQGSNSAWYNIYGQSNGAVQPSSMSVMPGGQSWFAVARPAMTTSWDPVLASELILKHPNWLRDMVTSSGHPTSTFAPTVFSSPTTLRYVDASSLAVNPARMSASSMSTISHMALVDETDRLRPADPPSSKRPFSPGQEVVFWAVRGENSVKLVGTVESVSAACRLSLRL